MDTHRIVATVAATLLAGALTSSAWAGNPPVTGTLSCSVASANPPLRPAGILFHPFLNATPRLVHLGGGNDDSSCDNSGVTGGKVPITGVLFKLGGTMLDATCTQLTTTPSVKNGHVKLQLRGLNPAGHEMTVGNAKADVVTTSYDSGSHTLTITTGPLKGRAFSGATATLHLGFDANSNVDVLEAGCTPGGGLLGMGFGEMNPSTLDVQ
jgi:hypothetical protein